MLRKQQSVDNVSSEGNPAMLGTSNDSLDRTLVLPSPSGRTILSPRYVPEITASGPPRNPNRTSITMSEGTSTRVGTMSIHNSASFIPSSQVHKKSKTRRPSTATGATGSGSANKHSREEVTPWEFQTLGSNSALKEKKIHIRELQMTKLITPSTEGGSNPYSSGGSGAVSPDQSPRSTKATSSPSLSTLSFTPMPPSIISAPSTPIVGGTPSSQHAVAMFTGPIADVTPWELYPSPRPQSASNSMSTTSNGFGGVGTNNLASLSTSGLGHISSLLTKRLATNTRLVAEVTPWELAPGPERDADMAPPPSPTSRKDKIASLFKKPDSKLLKRSSSSKSTHTSSPSLTNITPLPDMPMDLMVASGGKMSNAVGIGIPLQCSPVKPRRSVSQMSEQSFTDSRQGQSQGVGGIKLPRPGSRGGKDQRDSHKSSFNAGVTEKARQQPLTGPLEEVAPWEVHSALLDFESEMEMEQQKKKKIRIGGGRSSSASLINHGHTTAMPSFPVFATSHVDLWNIRKPVGKSVKDVGVGNYYTHEDGRSMSSSALPLTSPNGAGGRIRRRADSVATSAEGGYVKGEGNLSRGRSLTGDSTTAASDSGHRERIGATSVSGMNFAQMEAITPWELFPTPKSRPSTSGSGMGVDERDRKVSRASTSSTASKALAELGLTRRKSATGKNTTAAVTHVPPTPFSQKKESVPVPSLPAAGSGSTSKGIQSASLSFSSPPSQPLPSGQSPLPVATVPSTTSSGQSRRTRSTIGKEKGYISSSQTAVSTSDGNLEKFSTADRTILEELKANIRAREAQFSIKGIGHTTLGGGKSPGKKYHPCRKDEVPYPRSYDREVLDLDVWETMFWLDLCKGLSWHTFEKPPTRVLEIGCGTGTWILEGARRWKSCHFVGVDIVPLHPNLQNFASPDLSWRITWVQHNFLDGLPFQNDEFDFVHIKRIALGVPEDKWDSLLEEVHRVMKPGGALEMIEEDLFFPGKRLDCCDDVSTLSVDEPSTELPQIVKGEIAKSHPVQGPAQNSVIPSTSNSSEPQETLDDIAPRNPRDHTILDAIWQSMLESRFVNASPLSLLPTYLEYHFKDVRTHPPLLYSFPPLPTKLSGSEMLTETNAAATSQKPPTTSPKASGFQPLFVKGLNTADLDEELPTKSHIRERSLYVALDETRSDALSPSEFSHIAKKKDVNHTATLPSRKLVIDIRTLNLHLALRAKEIIACSEPMWEWVQKYQRSQQVARKPRYRSDSIEAALLGSARALNGREADALTKDVITEMTREDFDQMLNNFQLDMQDKASIGHVLEQRFSWQTFPSDPLLDRKAFDSACQKYDEWLTNEVQVQAQLASHSEHSHPRNIPLQTEGSDPAVPTSPLSNVPNSGMVPPTLMPLPPQLSPCQQLSRAMRVFVAWKASSQSQM